MPHPRPPNTSPDDKQKSFWNILAKKARSAFLDDGSSPPSPEEPEKGQKGEFYASYQKFTGAKASTENQQHQVDGPSLQKRFQAITSSLSVLGDTIGNAIEEGLSIVESKATDFISSDRHHFTKKVVESSKLNQQQDLQCTFTKRPAELPLKNQPRNPHLKHAQFQEAVNFGESSADKETQLQASRDVAMAMAAKTKLLLRELKEAKEELVLAKERCRQLEEENKKIRGFLLNGSKPEEEDIVSIQLEILLAEKARLAQENVYYVRENQFLRELLNYHQFKFQQVNTLLDEDLLQENEIPFELDIETCTGSSSKGTTLGN